MGNGQRTTSQEAEPAAGDRPRETGGASGDGPRQAARGAPPPSKGGGTAAYPEAVDRLLGELTKLPGVGRRGAERIAFHLLKSAEPEAMGLSRAIADAKRTVRHCGVCANLAQTDPCAVCASPERDRGTVLVVEQPRDLIALEQTGMYRGLYHVLMGRLSPLDGVGPGELTAGRLLERIDHPEDPRHGNPGGVRIEEVILGLNPTVEGDGTGLYLAQELQRRGVRVSRLARGLPTGGQLEYASKAVLADAIQGRQTMES